MLDTFVHIRHRINVTSIFSNEIVGHLVPNVNEIQQLRDLATYNILDEFVLVNDKNRSINRISEGQEIQIKLYPLHLRNEKYYENLEDLIKAAGQCYPSSRFYVHAVNFDSENSVSKPDIILNYQAVTQLISFLRKISDYQKEHELVFFQAKQLVIFTDYSIADFGQLDNVSALIAHITESADQQERKIIFTNELIATLSKISEVRNRFKYLLKHFDDLFFNYKRSHNLYLDRYSYQKFKSEIDQEIIEYSKKLQAVINDVQGKLVAIPAAFFLIISQFDLTGNKFYLNFSLALSALVFSFLLDVLLRNQFSALDFISDDIQRFESSVDEKKISVLGDDFTVTFNKINKLYNKQKTYLKLIRYIIWMTSIGAAILFCISLYKKYGSYYLI
jgi:hypothetical protein